MGNQPTHIQYSVECSQKKEGETSVRRAPSAAAGLKRIPEQGIYTMQEAWFNSVKKHENQMCLYTRNKETNVYEGKTYSEVDKLARAIGSGIIHEGLVHNSNEDQRFRTLKMIGVFAKNCEEWMILDISSMIYGHVTIPLYDTLGPQNITYCLKHSGITAIFASGASVTQLAKTQDIGSLRVVVQMDDANEEDIQSLINRGIKFYKWNQLLTIGNQNLQNHSIVKENDCLTFSYTSGTTGDPKAAMLSHSNFLSQLATLRYHDCLKILSDDIHLSYLPLPHVYERVCTYACLTLGAKVYGDVLKLKEDLATVRPTFFISVPRLYNRFYDLIRQQFEKQTGAAKALLNVGLSSKLDNLKKGQVTHALYDNLIFNKTKQIFGGRCRFLVTSSAPISQDVKDFMKVISCCPMVEAYGQTESSGASFSTHFDDPESGNTGGPSAASEFKLVDVPDMNYFSTDKNDQGESQPRGEICIKGSGVFLGYFKDIAKTQEVVDSEGWLHTGDVGTILAHNKALKIIDRKKNIFKLQQGEYVAPEKVENSYMKVRGIAEVFVHGESLQSYTVCIAVPDPQYIQELAKSKNIEGTFEQLCQNEQIVSHVLAQLEKQGRGDKLLGFELAKRLYLHHESMALLGCMTNTMKLQRHLAKNVFKQQIDQMYSQPLNN